MLEWFAAISPKILFVSVLTLAELSRGAELLRRKDARSAIALDHWIAEARLNLELARDAEPEGRVFK